tara:strand:- start:312 stop:1337 length:1026 start_codon:yes stop_codon:yes gene_type:complete
MFSFLRKKDHAADNTSKAEPLNISSTVDAAADEESNLFGRLKQRLSRSSSKLTDGFSSLFFGEKTIDDNLLEELESQLLSADIGIDATQTIILNLTQRMQRNQLGNSDILFNALRDDMIDILTPSEKPLVIPEQAEPYVILMVGINGVGKTTTIGKLAKQFQSEGKSVMLVAGDTFRAAAVEQLQVWGERNGIPVVAQQPGADSASVIFDGLQAAKARNIDVLIADTAGRLHTQENLMEELKKVKRVMGKLDAHAPHEVMLVLDAGTGQNALTQATQFQQVVDVTGITLTKLDGTAKGGIIFAIAKKLKLPIRYIGVGEAIDDLRPFKAAEFVDALLGRED